MAAALGLHVLMMYLPLGRQLLQTSPVDIEMWAALAMLATIPLIVLELQKWRWRIRRNGSASRRRRLSDLCAGKSRPRERATSPVG